MSKVEWVKKWGPGILAWSATCSVPTFFDWWAISRHPEHPTQSRTLGHFLPNALGGPVLFGIFAGLGYHLFIEELLASLGLIKGPLDVYCSEAVSCQRS